MDAAIGWMVLTGLCFAVYVVARLSSLTAEVRGVKGQVAHLSRHEFWSAGPQPWTSARAWGGQPFPIDHALPA